MNRDQLAGHWKQFRGQAKEMWGTLTGDGRAAADGKRDRLAGLRQQEMGDAEARAEREFGGLVPALVPATIPSSAKQGSRVR
jgi:uncharacterized protein YjbJ (UPF0337 family)